MRACVCACLYLWPCLRLHLCQALTVLLSQKKAKQRKELNLERYETASEASDDEQQTAPEKQVKDGVARYEEGDTLTTVTTAPIALESERYSTRWLATIDADRYASDQSC